MANLQDFVGIWRSVPKYPMSTHTFTWQCVNAQLVGRWVIEPHERVEIPEGSPQSLEVPIGEPRLENGVLLFETHRGPFVSEFRLISPTEAVVGASLDHLPPPYAGPEHQRSIEGHRVRLERAGGLAFRA